MSRFIGAALAAGSALLLVAGAASAQTPSQYYSRPNYGIGYRPELNPYLNLANTSSNPGLNYFLHTLPEFNRLSTQNIFGNAIGDLELRALYPAPAPGAAAATDAALFTPLPMTGHPVAFGNTLGYFPTSPFRPSPATPATYQQPTRK